MSLWQDKGVAELIGSGFLRPDGTPSRQSIAGQSTGPRITALETRFGLILPIYRERSTATTEYVAEIAHTKRLLECCEADDQFCQALSQDPRSTSERYGLQSDADALRALWDPTFDHSLPVNRTVQRYRAFVQEKYRHRDELRQTSRPLSPRFQAWRQRQMVRTVSQLGSTQAHGIVHPLAAFELSKGCSVGCWFCGVSAPKLGDMFSYTNANRDLWRDICRVWREEIGPAAERAFLYWATDPLDNPDYEKFACDFHELCGGFPQTTTAIALRDVDRTKRLLKLSAERGCLLDRFSVLSAKILKRIHASFTAEELAFVELVMQIRKDTASKAVSGRALERALKTTDESQIETSTIACVSGFLINMVEGTIKLISPRPASSEDPLGYRVFGESKFTTAEEFREHLQRLTSNEVMPVSVGVDSPVALRPDLSWRMGERGLILESTHLRLTFDGLPHPEMERLAGLLEEGRHTASQVALKLDADMATTFLILNRLLGAGVLEDCKRA